MLYSIIVPAQYVKFFSGNVSTSKRSVLIIVQKVNREQDLMQAS